MGIVFAKLSSNFLPGRNHSYSNTSTMSSKVLALNATATKLAITNLEIHNPRKPWKGWLHVLPVERVYFKFTHNDELVFSSFICIPGTHIFLRNCLFQEVSTCSGFHSRLFFRWRPSKRTLVNIIEQWEAWGSPREIIIYSKNIIKKFSVKTQIQIWLISKKLSPVVSGTHT